MTSLFFTKFKKTRQKVVRFRRRGNIHYPLFEIVLTYRDRRNGGFVLEKLGFYNPHGVKRLYINTYRLGYWILRGALVNYNVKKHLVKFLYP